MLAPRFLTTLTRRRACLPSAALLFYVGLCASVFAEPPDRYEGSLDRTAPRGSETVRFNVPGSGRPEEIAVLPRHLEFAKYRDQDLAHEKELARYDFYKIGDTPDEGAVALVPKEKSTSAAVELFNIPKGSVKPDPETVAYCNQIQKTSKDLAKFKQTDNVYTTTCTAAILGYYHASRILGGICDIQPAILRTMDIEQHKKIVRLAAESNLHGTVAKSWALFNRYYANPQRSSVARTLFTNDFTQIYGALLRNTRGEEHYADWAKAGSNLQSTAAFRDMADPRPASRVVGSTEFTQPVVQRLVAMRDMGEMILIDYLLAQSDRLTGGNIADFQTFYYLENGKVKNSRNAEDLPAGAPKMVVRKLTLVDTDAGLLNQNVFEKKGYLAAISHLHPQTYQRLLDFAEKWKTDPAVRAFFHEDCTFTNAQLARFGSYLTNAAKVLKQKHDSGKLLLDLDLDTYFHPGTPSSPAQANPVRPDSPEATSR
jgi:hypothetical protein